MCAWSDGICLPKLALYEKEPWFPGNGKSTCQWEEVNDFLFLLSLHAQLLLYLGNCLYLSP